MFNKNDRLAVNAIRALSIAQIEKANSGHPGLPMGAAPMAYVLYNKILKANPENANWFDRDRFILSAGHGSSMLYSLLHLSGYRLSMDELKEFRQIGSLTPGHPEYGHTEGVEVTTGPLGQGIAQAVGMAMAEKHMAALYNKEEAKIIDHYTYALCGDGDLMEGVSYESMSLAGHLKLDKLIVLYDSNDICLDGDLNTSFSENVEARVKAQGWNYLRVEDGNDLEAIYEAIIKAKENTDGPTLIEVKTVIGYGSANAGTNKVHGAPIGADDFAAAKKVYGWDYPDFEIPEEVYETFKNGVGAKGKEANNKWEEDLKSYQEKYPEDYKDLMAGINRELPANFMDQVKKYDSSMKGLATRASGGEIIQDLAKITRNFWGGSADLFSSNKTNIKDSKAFRDESPEGRNIWYGVREFAMAAIGNGVMAHGGSFHHVSTFFVFADYLKAAVRLSALSGLPLTYAMTHDSVAVGEDGPTHEPIEQLAMLRAIPNTIVLRPADANETRLAWKVALESKDKPVVIALTRQNIPNLKETEDLDNIDKGAYIIKDAENPDLVLIATGSEVALAIETSKALEEEGKKIRVVSMPSMELFRAQDDSYKKEILPKGVKKVSIEMGTTFGWAEWTGACGLNIGIDRFGISGKGDLVQEELGFSVEAIKEKIDERFFK
ncbi:Transketolase [Anaerococcus prevotii]|uniref:Transketolase n=1 Tax=Anaerococcus prevotii (strain ATCC 9321 / DSM 20548 / JCM 6508 / NCTC 11806 / PC1) TaxID=525919 RepID=C7REM4_ANAPD|nr:transketolase [Anaerococcus prevotii]ACV29637.1 transketolase [Anaerococcus prevotii DSM 20548]SUU95310.1 Transketolase [Anaerococcus prevotii]